jgi:hypothetical protein
MADDEYLNELRIYKRMGVFKLVVNHIWRDDFDIVSDTVGNHGYLKNNNDELIKEIIKRL